MNISLSFVRTFFLLMCVLFITTYVTTIADNGASLINILIGIGSGTAFGFALIGTDYFFKRFNLRSFNIAILGLFIGYLMGEALLLIFNTVLNVSTLPIQPETASLIRIVIFLFAAYLGMVMTARAAEELHVSIPFIKFKPTVQKKKDLLVDASVLGDSRIIDLASSGLLDHHLILPRFVLKDLHAMAESQDDLYKVRSRRCLDVVKKLENIAGLDLRYADADFPEVKDLSSKLIRLARLQDANILTADLNRIQQSSIEGVRLINLNTLANALKPITQSGESINIKIQRYGKEARQGVGYLEDGTMVVVNGGAEYIGETIKAQVLSVKHTSSGRMIFCNATDENLLSDSESAQSVANLNCSAKNYFMV